MYLISDRRLNLLTIVLDGDRLVAVCPIVELLKGTTVRFSFELPCTYTGRRTAGLNAMT